jgi:hypothetical protein
MSLSRAQSLLLVLVMLDSRDQTGVSNSNSLSVSSTVCTCNAGYTGPDDGACSTCLPGSFKTQTDSAACALCPNNTFSDTGGNSSCVPCQTNTVSVSGIASQTYCYYKIGYTHTVDMSTCLRVDRQRDVSSVSGGSVVAGGQSELQFVSCKLTRCSREWVTNKLYVRHRVYGGIWEHVCVL